MVLQIPAPLASVDVRRFALRASQLEKYKPVIAYWCEYFIVHKILEKGLHVEIDECMTYTTTLMDKLERTKSERAGDDAIHDDMAAQAYVEQFAQETFQRAENVMSAGKVTAQTADTFTAAGTFFDLMAIWQKPIDQEIAAKSRYAKFHAVRIAKALKAGEDPNLSNPVREAVEPAIEPPPLDPDDPEVRQIQSLQPTVEDGSDPSRPGSFYKPRASPPTLAMTSSPPAANPFVPSLQHNQGGDVSPLEPSPPDEYFPRIEPPSVQPHDYAMTGQSSPQAPAGHPTLPTLSSPGNPQDFYTNSSAPSVASPPASVHSQPPPLSTSRAPSHPQMPNNFATPHPTQSSPNSAFPHPQPQVPSMRPQPSYQPPQSSYPPPPQPQAFQSSLVNVQPASAYRTDDEAVMAAQKHAKWAISALNFEDVPTAVKELTIALQALGAR